MQERRLENQPFPTKGAKRPRRSLLDAWYQLAALPELPSTAPFRERELARKMRTSSIAILTIFVNFILFLPGCLVFFNHYVMYPETIMPIICLIALFLNKKRHPILAGGLVTFSFELSLMFVCLTTVPFDAWHLQLYELFVLSEIMALTLVSPRGMLAIGGANVVFIILHLLLQKHTSTLDYDLQTQFTALIIMPIAIQIMVAVVVSWYAGNQLKTVQLANRAEMTARLEHQQVEQSKKAEIEKNILQKQIEQIVATHAQTMNTHRVIKIPLDAYPPLLWPLINAFNSQQARLNSAWMTEAEFQRLQQAIMQRSEQAMAGQLNLDQPTGTPLDSLLFALKLYR